MSALLKDVLPNRVWRAIERHGPPIKTLDEVRQCYIAGPGDSYFLRIPTFGRGSVEALREAVFYGPKAPKEWTEIIRMKTWVKRERRLALLDRKYAATHIQQAERHEADADRVQAQIDRIINA